VRTTTTIRAALLVLCVAAPASVEARGLWGRTTSLLHGYVQPAGSETANYMPFYQQIELRTTDVGLEGLSVNTSFWGMVDIRDRQESTRFTGDLNTLFVSYRVGPEGKLSVLNGLELTAGRQFVALGPTVLEQVDGGKLHYIHSSGLEVGVFGGAPTGIRFTNLPWPMQADSYGYTPSWLVGARLGYVNLGFLSGGTSFVHRRYDNQVADSDLGLDATISPWSFLDVLGMATVSLESLRIKEARGAVTARPIRALDLEAGYRFSSPDLWVPRTSIFAVFSEETFHEAHIEARWRITRSVSLDGGYGRRFYGASTGQDGSTSSQLDGGTRGANRASLGVVYRFLGGGRLKSELERVEAPDNAANRLRLATTVPLHLLSRTFQLVADLELMIMDETIRGTRYSFLGGGFLQVPIIPSLRVLAGGTGGVTPLLSQVGTFTVRLTWDFEALTESGGVAVKRGRSL
jgi:hypothetical protein